MEELQSEAHRSIPVLQACCLLTAGLESRDRKVQLHQLEMEG